ncbi:MAG: WecB/TagA/CpsF family glycosyltransferase [Oscillospiraceae bacterium]
MTLPDGKPLSVVGKKRGAVEMGQVRGLDLMKNIFSNCQLNGYKHYFYGSTKENLDTLIEKLKQDYPTLNIVGYKPSVFRELTEDELESLAAEIKKTGADFLWVALGAPRQEFFCSRIQGKTGAVPVGVGGAFNVLSGIVPDAPKLMKKLSLEWLYRFIKEPRRLFKRYFTTNFKFIFYLLMEKKR